MVTTTTATKTTGGDWDDNDEDSGDDYDDNGDGDGLRLRTARTTTTMATNTAAFIRKNCDETNPVPMYTNAHLAITLRRMCHSLGDKSPIVWLIA